MIKHIRKASDKIGIDGAIAFTLLSRVIQAGGGFVTLFFVAKCLTKVEQGYYYTFGSILAIQIFFELGLETIIAQFVAHENAHLIWNDKVSFIGSEKSGSRLSSLLRFTVKWFIVIAVLLFVGLLISGYFFFGIFGKNDAVIEWQIPWLIMAVTTSLSLILSPVLSFFEGLGMIKDVAKIRLFQQILQMSILYLLFSLGFKLYSSPIAAILAFFIIPIWVILSSKIKLLTFIWNKLGDWKVNYRLEIFPYQWKIALSWMSGYFIFQLFNPVIFATEGPIVAGQMGMTLTVLNSIYALSFSWISTKVPMFSGLIARKEYIELDNIFKRTLIQSSVLNALMLGVFYSLIFVLRYFDIKIGGKNFGDRFLSYLPMLFMMIPIFLNHFVASWATYMRCHKKEPMFIQSVVIGLLCSISTLSLGNYFGVVGITSGYMILTVIGFVWTYFTFKNKKHEWHN